MEIKALDLFQAYSENKLPKDGGFIVSSFLAETSPYSIYEIVGYSSVKNIYLADDGLTFQSDGNKLFVLVEPVTYPKKYIEPFRRDSREKIPHRFAELDIISTKDQSKIMVSKEPIMSYSSFTIMRPTGLNFSFVFFNRPDVADSLKLFFEKTLNKESNVPRGDATNGAKAIIKSLERFSVF